MNDATAEKAAEALATFIHRFPRLTVLTGAGCSTASGIPDYRDDDGRWKHRQPMQFNDFVANDDNRRRYWAQSYAGWQRISGARPSAAHDAIARLEKYGRVKCVVTQNVDNLHRAAGSKNVIDLHGVLHEVCCLDCNRTRDRGDFQESLKKANPEWSASIASIAPDGDAQINRRDFRSFKVPNCDHCGGVLKPNVVFFGEAVPAARVVDARIHIENSQALLVVGSSLMVYSGFRFARDAVAAGIPILIVNRGKTRADDFATFKCTGDCSTVLSLTSELLAA